MRSFNAKPLVFAGVFIALTILFTYVFSIQTPFVRLSFGFLPVAIYAAMFGPVRGGITAAAADIIREAGLDDLWQVLADKIRLRCQRRVFGEIEVGVVLFERGYGLLAQTENAAGMIDGAKAECEA